MRIPILRALGASSRSSPICLVPSDPATRVAPVAFLSGRLRLVTRPDFTGSTAVENTIGVILAVLATIPSAFVVSLRLTLALTTRCPGRRFHDEPQQHR